MKTLISTDTSCLVNYEVLKKYNISVFPLNVIIDGSEFLDGINIDQKGLYEAMTSKKTIKTSTPPLGAVIDYFEELFEQGYDHIIHFTISSKLSSMYDLFTNVSKTEFDNKITVIDSYALSSVMLSNVLYAYEEVQKGTDVKKIVKEIEERKTHSFIAFIPENLNALKNGGRISPAIALIGNTLKLKPLILLKDGELVKDSMTRIISKTFIELINAKKDEFPADKYDYCVISFNSDETVLNKIYNHLDTVIGKNYVKGIIPINVCAHCGPGTIGLLISPKVNNKDLIEYVK